MCPLVTIIVPVYNCEKTVVKALDSIPKRKDVQVIIIDDCSTDSTAILCTAWLTENKNYFNSILLKHTEVNSGCGAAKNIGYDSADGKWIWSLDGDDYFITEEASNVILTAETCFTDLIQVDNETNEDPRWTGERPAAWAYLVRKDFLGDLRCPEHRRGADWHLYQKLKEKRPIIYVVARVAYHYNYLAENSITLKYKEGLVDEYGNKT